MTSDNPLPNPLPRVSVIVPCRNEEAFIVNCVESIFMQDYPPSRFEILVADGMSDDSTKALLIALSRKHENLKLFENPHRTVPYALNLMIRNASGDVVIRVDAHAEYPNNYISTLVEHLYELNADNVGGVWETTAGADTSEAKAIVLATSHKLGIGNAAYRLGANQPIEVDTVPYGCYRKQVFDKIGFFDEQLTRNQDDEFNARLIKNGGKIFLIPSVRIKYYARRNLKSLRKMFYQYGYYKPLVGIKLGYPATLRQLAPPLFMLGLLLLFIGAMLSPLIVVLFTLDVLFYTAAIFVVSLSVAAKHGFGLFGHLLLTFPSIHFSYGVGYLHGILDFMILRKHKRTAHQPLDTNR